MSMRLLVRDAAALFAIGAFIVMIGFCSEALSALA